MHLVLRKKDHIKKSANITMDLFDMQDVNMHFGMSKLFHVPYSKWYGSEHNNIATLVLYSSKTIREALFENTFMWSVGAWI